MGPDSAARVCVRCKYACGVRCAASRLTRRRFPARRARTRCIARAEMQRPRRNATPAQECGGGGAQAHSASVRQNGTGRLALLCARGPRTRRNRPRRNFPRRNASEPRAWLPKPGSRLLKPRARLDLERAGSRLRARRIFFFFFFSEIPLSLTQDTSWFFEHVLPSIYYMRDTGRKRPRAYCPGPCLLVIAAR